MTIPELYMKAEAELILNDGAHWAHVANYSISRRVNNIINSEAVT